MLCFFVSGVAGLVYQVAWARYLALFLGHTSYAIVAVLVAFMGGLAVGNAMLGPVADRVEKPLALYGWLQLGITAYALIFPWYYEFCHDLYITVAKGLGSGGGTPLLLLKFAFSFLTILVPTAMMGATFPVLTRFVTRTLAELRERVAELYFINSLGAVAGCLVADFWWIPEFGLELAIYGAGLLNFAAGVVALGVSRAILEGAPSEASSLPAPVSPSDEVFTARDLKIATVAIGLSGFVAMLYEVAWTRLLGLALGSSTHAFSIMLMTFISGIAAGALIVARSKRIRNTMAAFGWAELALAGTVLLSMFTYELLPFWFAKLANLLARRPESYPLYEGIQFFICFIVMFIPALCLGMTLPLASRIATAEVAKTGRSVGRIFAVNTIGTVLGAAVTGLLLMPTFGLATTFAIGFVLNAGIGLLILGREHLGRINGPVVAGGVAAAVGVAFAAHAHFEPLWRASFTQGVWRVRDRIGTFKQFRENGSRYRFNYYKDGAGSTVALHHMQNVPNDLALRVNGKTDASSGDTGTQLLLGHLPCLLRPEATNALVVGLGSGMTVGAVLRHTNVLSAQVVEISPEIAEAAPLFGAFNDHALKNPRCHVAIEDAKSFLKTTGQKFDIIVNEPSNPWMAGVASVFSLEFYESCRDRLAKDGVVAQWVQVYETSDATLQTVVKTFGSVFPHISIWYSQAGDLILIGTVEKPVFDPVKMVQRMSDPRVAADLRRGGFSEPLSLLARQVTSPENTMLLPRADTMLHSDFFPILEYMSQVGFFVGSSAKIHETMDESRSPRATTLLGDYLRKHPMADEDFRRVARASLDGQFQDEGLLFSLMQRWSLMETNLTLPLEMLERIRRDRPPEIAEELRLAPKHDWLVEQGKTDIAALHFYERVLMRAYRMKRSVFWSPDTAKLEHVLGILLERDPDNRRVFNFHLSEIAWDRGDDQSCLRFGALGFEPDLAVGGKLTFVLDELAPRQTLYNMIDAYIRRGDLPKARTLATNAEASGYLARGPLFFPPLEFICRKVAKLTEAQAPAAAK